ncbi:helix-turn-helix domain-containing protein [Paenibacillus rhizoplanae]
MFFKETTGISPKRYHTEHLMRQAKMMLLSGLPIKHVAVSLGYGDIYSFTKQFTKSEGVSPGRYIRKNKTCSKLNLNNKKSNSSADKLLYKCSIVNGYYLVIMSSPLHLIKLMIQLHQRPLLNP